MDLGTLDDNADVWSRSHSIPQGLWAAHSSAVPLVVRCMDPIAETDALVAMIKVLVALGVNGGRVAVASAYPSRKWMMPCSAEGVNTFYLISRTGEIGGTGLSRSGMLRVPRDLCPGVHVRSYRDQLLSVCVNRDRPLALTMRHYNTWCFGRWRSCPYAVHLESGIWPTTPRSHLEARGE